MGIRFRCHHCEAELHVKDFQAGKRGRCPECGGRFRVPLADAPQSLDPEMEPLPLTPAELATAADLDAGAQTVSSVDTAHTAATSDLVSIAGAATPAASVDSSLRAPLPDPPPQAPPPLARPRALQMAAEGNWYVRPASGSQYGPASSITMWQWLSENRVGRDALVWTEGWAEWVLAEKAFDDYFQTPTLSTAAEMPPAQPPAATAGLQVAPTGRSEIAPAAVALGEPLLRDRSRAERKQKRRRHYTLMIAGLAVLMLILIATLIYVLGSQAS